MHDAVLEKSDTNASAIYLPRAFRQRLLIGRLARTPATFAERCPHRWGVCPYGKNNVPITI